MATFFHPKMMPKQPFFILDQLIHERGMLGYGSDTSGGREIVEIPNENDDNCYSDNNNNTNNDDDDDYEEEKGEKKCHNRKVSSPTPDFHGLQMEVNLEAAVHHLLRYIHTKWPLVIERLIDDWRLLNKVVERYTHFLQTCAAVGCMQDYDSGSSDPVGSPQDLRKLCFAPPDDAIHIVWICHMVDSWAYYNDCLKLCGSRFVDHSIFPEYQLPVPPIMARKSADDITLEEQPLSINIHAAAKWLHGMCKTFSLPHFADPKFIKSSIRRYMKFLAFLRTHPACFVTMPRPADIMLIWMAHAIHPRSFRKDISLMLGDSASVMLERRNIWPPALQMLPDPHLAWKDMFRSDLVLSGTVHRSDLPHHALSDTTNFVSVIRPYMTMLLCFNDKTTINEDNWFVDVNENERHKIVRRKQYVVSCHSNSAKVVVRYGIWPRYKWMLAGHLSLPMKGSEATLRVKNVGVVSWSPVVDSFQLTLIGRHLGRRVEPHIVCPFAEIPRPTDADLIVFSLATSSSEISNQLSFHFYPEFGLLLTLFNDNKPIIVCKLLTSRLLPRPGQLCYPESCPHMYEDDVCIMVHSLYGEQAILITDTHNRRKTRICALNKIFDGQLRMLSVNGRKLQPGRELIHVNFNQQQLAQENFPGMLSMCVANYLFKPLYSTTTTTAEEYASAHVVDNPHHPRDIGSGTLQTSSSSHHIHQQPSQVPQQHLQHSSLPARKHSDVPDMFQSSPRHSTTPTSQRTECHHPQHQYRRPVPTTLQSSASMASSFNNSFPCSSSASLVECDF